MAIGGTGGGTGGRGSRGRRGRTRRAPMADINVTPLVDVMLVLLIIFMVTAPLLTAGVPVDLPDSAARPLDQQAREPVQISLDRAGDLFIDDRPVTMAGLAPAVDAIAADRARREAGVMLRADRGLDYGRVMRVMGELNRAGITRVSLVTTSSSAGE